MTVVVCVDDNGGMLFNNRRQSRDSLLVADLVQNHKNIIVNPYSASLFKDYFVTVADAPLDVAGACDTCFVENINLSEYTTKIKTLVIYRWNRTYPFDTKLDITPNLLGMTLKETYDFSGSSHEKITKEIYSF